MVEWIEVAICLLLFYLALGTKKLNHISNRIGVEKFGSFLTVYSVIIFLFEKTLISQMANIELVISLSNEKFQVFIIFLLLEVAGIVGAIDNLGGGSVDSFYEPYINGEKELRQLNEEYRSNSGKVK